MIELSDITEIPNYYAEIRKLTYDKKEAERQLKYLPMTIGNVSQIADLRADVVFAQVRIEEIEEKLRYIRKASGMTKKEFEKRFNK